jgi:hypothetical protein
MKKSAQQNSGTAAAPAQKSHVDYDQEVSRRAYELWVAAGGHHGDDLRHWLEAEREAKARRQDAKPT